MTIHLPYDCRAVIALQQGVIGRGQALKMGMAPDSIETLLRSGRWRRLYHGVYATFTGTPSREAMLWAVLMRAGPGAALSHETAAELYGFARHVGEYAPPTHVTVPHHRHHTQIPGVILHRVGNIAARCHPFLMPPRTTVEATVLDLIDGANSADEAFGWVCRAVGERLISGGRLDSGIRQRGRLRWRAAMLDALGDVEEGVRSNLEFRYVREVERPHGLPRAQRQVRVVRSGRVCYLDNLYAAYAVGVELDGLVAHPPGERWRDLRRDNAGLADGIMTLRYGWADVTGRPCEVASQVAAVLRRRGWPGSPRACGSSCAAGRQASRA